MRYLFFICTLLFSSQIIQAQDRAADSLALIEIYESLNGEDWTSNNNWHTNEAINIWQGVTIDSGRVVRIFLKENNASGIFPMSITKLDKLRTFEMSNIPLSTPIPAEIGQLKELTRVTLKGCEVSGTIPDVFHQLPKLESLVLNNNNLTGSLPQIGEKLDYLKLSYNQLSGPIPANWADKNLTTIAINNNQLTGAIDILSGMTQARNWTLSNNNWDKSPFPNWLDDIPALQFFNCEDCNFTGDIPTSLDFTPLENYASMHISENNLSGDISLLFNNQNLNTLYLTARSNNFSGTIPTDQLTNISTFDVRDNHYSNLNEFDYEKLATIDCRSNNLDYTALSPLLPLIESDSITVHYTGQANLLNTDTIAVSSDTIITIFAGDEHPLTTYQWKKDGQILAGETDKNLIVTVEQDFGSSTYSCALSNPNFPLLILNRNAFHITTDIISGITKISLDDYYLYPNPASDFIHFNANSSLDGEKYTIYSIEGQLMQSNIFDHTQDIEIRNLPTGKYLFNIQKGENVTNKIFFKH